jgi:hypothetical protein
MEEIIAELQRISKLEGPANQLGMPNYIRGKMYDVLEVIEKLKRLYESYHSELSEWESI